MSRRVVVVLDYGSGNVRSVERALARAGADVSVTADPVAVHGADGLVVPGVGAFAACMAGLRGADGPGLIERRLAAARPVLGICVGMQVLFDTGVEHGTTTAGCGVWGGRVERLDAPVLPHIGWNTVTAPQGSWLFEGIGGERFYFLHSYAARMWAGKSVATPAATGAATAAGAATGAVDAEAPAVTWSEHGERFVAAVEDGILSATQFHPEKSGDAGASLLANWLRGLA